MLPRGVMTAESWRVAQLVVDRGRGGGSRGSGYLVAPGLVLTAAHVVAEASAVRVRLDLGQRTEIDVSAEDWWVDPEGSNGTDLAVVRIALGATEGRDAEPARFGRIGDCTAVFAVQVFGFPRFKLRASHAGEDGPGVFRDLEQVTGHVPVAANRRQGTLAVYLDDPPPASPETRDSSPWAGMSGAAVWAGGRIVAVVAEHHADEGAGRLTARRVDRAYEMLPAPDLGRLVEWLGLASAADGIPDVVPARAGQRIRSAYLEQVRVLAPDELIARDGELAAWAEFCAGPDAYAWWQARPWAGKTALAAWFVTHPPVGVDIISFFITGRLAGQADSDAFLDAMIEQLTALAPDDDSPVVAGPRVGAWHSLLESSAALAEERGRRLVVVVDGLDEDDVGASPTRGRPSIASLLPRRPGSGVRIIVTSRPDPGLPDDVPDGHPLSTCIPHRLPVSWIAEDLARRAKQELRDLLTGDRTGIDVAGYIAGSGGGLTRSDLSALIAAPPRMLDPILRGVSGRSLETRATPDFRDNIPDPATRVYLFAHETLRVTAEEQLGDELARYRQQIHEWIGPYANAAWPDTTPDYAIRGYPRLLAATGDPTRLSALARDPHRHAFLLRTTGSEYAALAEIRAALRLNADQDLPDVQALVELAVYRHAISIRNQSIPVRLPAVWAQLARFDHAEALARSITDQHTHQSALVELARAMAQTGDPDRAEALARTVIDPQDQARALTDLARVAAHGGDQRRASRLLADAEVVARNLNSSYTQAKALAEVASAAARVGDLDRAEALARAISKTKLDSKVQALTAVARAAAQAGDLGRVTRIATDAAALARTLADRKAQGRALSELGTVAPQVGDPDRAIGLAIDAEALAHTGNVTDPYYQVRALRELADAVAQAGDPDRAEALARTITDPEAQGWALSGLASAAAQADDPDRADRLAADAMARLFNPYFQAWVLTELASGAARAGDPDRASQLVIEAEALARAFTHPYAGYPYFMAQALTGLGSAAAEAGDPDRASRLFAEAEVLARSIHLPNYARQKAQTLTELARAAAHAGDLDRAEAVARTITDPDDSRQVLAELAIGAAKAGDFDRAEVLALTIIRPRYQARALTELAIVALQVGDRDRASRLATDAEVLARTVTDLGDQGQMHAALARAAAKAGDFDHGEALARTITNPYYQAEALTELASAVAQAGDQDRASQHAADAEALLARSDATPAGQAEALTGLARAAVLAGDSRHASQLMTKAAAQARAITAPPFQTKAITDLAIVAAQAGDLDRADGLARTITDEVDQMRAFTKLAARAGDLGRASWLLTKAEREARTITNPNHQMRAFAKLASAAAQAGDPDRACRLAADAEALARTTTDRNHQARALIDLVIAAVYTSDPDRASQLASDAETLARTITNADDQTLAIIELARAAAQASSPDRAQRLLALALSAESPWPLSRAIEVVSHVFPSAIRGAGHVFMNAYKTEA